MSEERKPIWPWIMGVLVGLPVLYIALMGPACWISSHARIGASAVSTIYRPITTPLFELPFLPSSTGGITAMLEWYSSVGPSPGWQWQTDDVNLGEAVVPAGPNNWYWGHY